MLDFHISVGQLLVAGGSALLSIIGTVVAYFLRRIVDKFDQLDYYFEKTDVAYTVVSDKFPAEAGTARAEILRQKERGAV